MSCDHIHRRRVYKRSPRPLREWQPLGWECQNPDCLTIIPDVNE